jgi:hypothetical protein
LGIFPQIKEDNFGKEILGKIGYERILINDYADLLNG